MTISASANRTSATGNGVTTSFSFPYAFTAQADIVVNLVLVASPYTPTLQVLTTDYTISGSVDSVGRYTAGANIVFNTAPSSLYNVVIYTDPSVAQTLDLVDNDPFPAESVEKALDVAILICRRLVDRIGRSLRQVDGDTTDIGTLPAKGMRASAYLAFDASGDPIASVSAAGTAVVSTFMATVLDDTTAPLARATLGFPTIAAKGDLIVGTAADTLAKKAVGADGYSLVGNAADTDGLRYLPPGVGFSLINGYLDWSAAASALTVSIKGLDGNAPSTTNPVYAWVRNATVTTGVLTLVKITAATTAVMSSGSTGGVPANTTAFRVWAVLFDDGGTYRLGLIVCTTCTSAGVVAQYPLVGWGIATSTAEGGAGAADSAQTFYSTVAVTSKPYAVLGWASWETGLATIGTWVAPTRVQLFAAGNALPGWTIQAPRSQASGFTAGSTTTPNDDTIPQISEGDQYMTLAITPSSAANVLKALFSGWGANSGATNYHVVALHQDAVANALAVTVARNAAGSNSEATLALSHAMVAGLTVSTTLRIRIGVGANTFTLNGSAGARTMGGAAASSLDVVEVMA